MGMLKALDLFPQKANLLLTVFFNFVERGRLINTSSLFKNRLQHTLGSNIGENLFFPGGNRIKNRNGFGGIHYLVIQGNIVGDSLAVFFVKKR